MFRMLPALCLLPLALGVSCGSGRVGPPERPAIGARDRVALSDSPELAHLATALGGQPMTAGDLFTEDIEFRSAPDPSPLLKRFARRPAPADSAGRVKLRVLSYNVALYDPAWYMEFYDSASPHLEERRAILGRHLFKASYDILFVQEVMTDEDVARLRESASGHGYASYVSPRDRYNDRLMLFVHRDLLAGAGNITAESVPFHQSVELEYFPGPRVWRGYQRFSFEHPRLGTVHLYNTHMTAYAKNWRLRMEQARQLGLDMAAHAGGDGLSILGGDLNSAPYYLLDQWILPDGGVQSDRWMDAMPYALLLHYGGLVDLFVAGKEGDDCLLDLQHGRRVRNLPEVAAELPCGGGGFCEALTPEVLTAIDCNSLHFQSYGGKAYPARLDHLVACDPRGRIHVASSGLDFVERIPLNPSTRAELSNHYGIWAELVVAGSR